MLSRQQQQELINFFDEVRSGKIKRKDLIVCTSCSGRGCDQKEGSSKAVQEICRGDLYLSLEQRLVMVRDQVVELTAKEFDILVLMVKHPKMVFSYEMITEMIWDEQYVGYSRKAINNHMSNLRRKLKIAVDVPNYIRSVHGIGYKFEL